MASDIALKDEVKIGIDNIDFKKGVGKLLADEMYAGAMGREKQSRVVGDYTRESGYECKVSEKMTDIRVDGVNVISMDPDGKPVESRDLPKPTKIKEVSEKWNGGARTTRSYEDGYVASYLTLPDQTSISTQIDLGGKMSQETRCFAGNAKSNAWNPLIESGTPRSQLFLDRVQGYPSEMITENVVAENDGKVSDRRMAFYKMNEWLGGPGDRYRDTVYIYEFGKDASGGVVKFGTEEHGIRLGGIPELRMI